MSKYSQEYYQLSKEYLECKKGLFSLLGLLSVFGMVPVIFRFIIEEERIFNIPKGHYIGLANFISVLGIVVTSLSLLYAIKHWVSLRKEMKNIR